MGFERGRERATMTGARAKPGSRLAVPAFLTVAVMVVPQLGPSLGAPTRDVSIAATPAHSEAVALPPVFAALSPVTIQSENGEKIYQQKCQVCHGIKGKGDGPVASALKPPPADFTSSQPMDSLTNEDLLETISKGRGSMPAFAEVLKPEEIAAVIEYVRSLGDQEE